MRAMRGLARGILGVVIGGLLLVGCTGEIDEPTSIGSRHDPLEGDPTQEQCGLNPVEGPGDVPVDACLAGPGVTTIFGPEEFVRETGTPGEFTRTFEVSGEGSLCVRVVNHGMAAARILVDADEVIAPDAFSPNVPEVTASPELAAGEHTLDVRIASKPGTSITVEIRFVVPPQPQAVLVEGENGFVGLYNVYDDPDPFSPAGTDGLSTTTTFGVTGTALRTPGANSGNYEFLLRAYFEVAGGNVCGSIISLVTEADVADGAHAQLSAEWDGKDADGILQQEGTYYYRAAVELIRRRISDHAEEILDVALSEVQSVRIGDPFGLEGKTTRELNELIAPIKESVENYYDLSPEDRAHFDALMRARAARQSQLPVEERFMPVLHQSGPRYYPYVFAQPIYHQRHYFDDAPYGDVRRFATTNLRGLGSCVIPSDTFLVVTHLSSGETRYNDNCGPDAPAYSSCVYFSGAEAKGLYEITVFPPPGKEIYAGVADIVTTAAAGPPSEVVVERNFEFGGEVFELAGLPSRDFSFHTSHIPNGADNTMMLLFDENWKLKRAAKNDSGVEEAERMIAQPLAGDHLVVGAWAPSTKGWTSLVINDCVFDPDAEGTVFGFIPKRFFCYVQGLDQDMDNLSDALESELGTYAETDLDAEPPRVGHDTDRDGLWDYYEVIGRTISSGEQSLRRFGADPLRRDIFIEYDQYANALHVPSLAKVAVLRNIFMDLPEIAVNPDGSHEVAVHVDIGHQCADGNRCAYPFCHPLRDCVADCATLCGDWEGYEVLDDDIVGDPDTWYEDDNYRGHLAAVRHGLFRYAWNMNVTGQSQYLRPAFRDDHDAKGDTPAHELGHTLNLRHNGRPEHPAIDLTPAYPSVMNYAYQIKYDEPHYHEPRFSEGTRDPIIPWDLHESNYSQGADKDYLRGSPFHYDVGGFYGHPNSVDWNYDGRMIDTSAFDTSPMNDPYTGVDWPDLYHARTVGPFYDPTCVPFCPSVPTGGAALAVEPLTLDAKTARVWAFAPFQVGGDAVPHYSVIEDTLPDVGGIPWLIPPKKWPLWSQCGALPGWSKGEVSALYFEFAAPLGPRVLLVFPDESRQLWYLLLDPTDPYEPCSGMNWQPIEPWPEDARARNASLAKVGNHIELVFRDLSRSHTTDHIFLATMDADGSWDQSGPRIQSGVDPAEPLWSYFTPGIAEVPGGETYMAVVWPEAVGPETLDRPIWFYRRSSPDHWERAAELGKISNPWLGGDWGSYAGIEDMRRLTLLFLPFSADDVLYADGSGYLGVFWNSGYLRPEVAATGGYQKHWQFRRAYTTGFVSALDSNWGEDGFGPPKGWRVQTQIDRPYGLHSVAVARRWDDAVSLFVSSEWEGDIAKNAPPSVPLYVPYANGTPPTAWGVHLDTDDAEFIDANLCVSLHALDDPCQCESLDPTDGCPGEPPETEVVSCRPASPE